MHINPLNVGDRLEIVPLTQRAAGAFIAQHHRHHRASRGAKFCLGVLSNGLLVGVAMAGRPVAPAYDDGLTIEVTRVATDGARNACSALYAACWRAARAMGYRRAITYTLLSESGASLRGAGWRVIAQRAARSWAEDNVARLRVDQSEPQARWLWEAV